MPPPYGYRAEKKALFPVPEEQAVISEIVTMVGSTERREMESRREVIEEWLEEG